MSSTLESSERVIAALLLFREARGVSPAIRRDAYRAVMHVALNHVGRRHWRSTLWEVITQTGQFTGFTSWQSTRDARLNECDPDAVRWPRALLPAEWLAWTQACEVADDPGADPTDGANHFHSKPHGQEPAWAKGHDPVLVIGRLKFYRL